MTFDSITFEFESSIEADALRDAVFHKRRIMRLNVPDRVVDDFLKWEKLLPLIASFEVGTTTIPDIHIGVIHSALDARAKESDHIAEIARALSRRIGKSILLAAADGGGSQRNARTRKGVTVREFTWSFTTTTRQKNKAQAEEAGE
ncbi:hypothetical protein [Streptomyces sp. NPDC048644]|uniref:hypothetical protein n=1 Tax=Streptomyces sp. NPDC048644 TaxID=3365582 RepID=UPI003722EBDD